MNKRILLMMMPIVAWCATPASSQSLEKPTYHRWYVGTHFATHYYAVVFPSGLPSMGSPNPFQGTIGYQLSPRWAIQLSGLHRRRMITSKGTGTTTTGEPTTSTFDQTTWNTAVPVSLRHSFTRQATRRFQVDGALGLSFISTRFTSRRAYAVNGQVEQEYLQAQKTTGTYLTGGISARLSFGQMRRVEAVLDLLANRNVEQFNKDVYQYLDAPGGLTRAYSLGLRYRLL